MSGIAHHLEALISEYGVAALFVSVMLEALGAPLPGESAVILASTAAAAGKLDIYAVAAAAFLAAVAGDNIGYLLGRKLGRPVITRYGAPLRPDRRRPSTGWRPSPASAGRSWSSSPASSSCCGS